MRRWPSRVGATAWLLAALLVSSCGEPPNKEMDQAQGAIDAARAAGAEQYAASDYTAAQNSLKQAREAAAQRDYRLALSHALESREHAQNAARGAADTQAKIRGDVERLMIEVSNLRMQANTRLNASQARMTAARVRAARQALAQVTKELQEAGALLKKGEHSAAQPRLNGLKARLEKLVVSMNPPAAPRRVRTARDS